MNNFFKKLSKILGNFSLISLLAFLGALSGQRWKWLRRYIFPAIIMIYAWFIIKSFWVLTIYSMAGALSIGYGRYDISDDKVSFLGKLAYKLFPNSPVLQDVLIRGFVATLICISMLSIPILMGYWLSYLIGSVIIIGIWATISYRGFGQIPITLFGTVYQLLIVDLVVYGITACGLFLIINGYLG